MSFRALFDAVRSFRRRGVGKSFGACWRRRSLGGMWEISPRWKNESTEVLTVDRAARKLVLHERVR